MKPSYVRAIFDTFKRLEPEPKTELVASNPFEMLVAIVLSAQATDASVNKATPALFKRASTPEAMAALSVDDIRDCIKTIGLFNAKAKNVHALSVKLMEEYGGNIPEKREALQTLPGVGRKTANVWLNNILGQPTMAVDTHVQRVANRLGLCRTKTPDATEAALVAIIPDGYMRHAHHWLILHGRYICKARKPECPRCPVRQWCEFEGKAAN